MTLYFNPRLVLIWLLFNKETKKNPQLQIFHVCHVLFFLFFYHFIRSLILFYMLHKTLGIVHILVITQGQ